MHDGARGADRRSFTEGQHHLMIKWARNVAEILHDGDLVVRPSQQKLYNAIQARTFDAVRWFLAIHYKFNTRITTPFWTECRQDVNYSGAADVVEFYEQNGPSGFSRALLDPTDPFGIEGYLVLLVGQKAPTRTLYHASQQERALWQAHVAAIRKTADAGVTPEEAMPQLKSPAWKWERRNFA